MDNELMNEETTEQATEENPSGDAAAGELGGNDNNTEAGRGVKPLLSLPMVSSRKNRL